MANIEVHPPVHRGGVETKETDREKRIELKRKGTIGGVAVEVLAAVGAVVLAIIGLAGVFPVDLAAVAAICAGTALLFEGLSVAAQLHPRSSVIAPREPVTGEVGVEALAGLGGIALGIIALAGAATFTLLPITAIVLGAGMLFAVHPLTEVTHATEYNDYDDTKTEVMHGAAAGISGIHAFAGVAGIVLGIIGLVMPNSVTTYSLVTFLILGGTVMLGSAALGGKLAGYLHR